MTQSFHSIFSHLFSRFSCYMRLNPVKGKESRERLNVALRSIKSMLSKRIFSKREIYNKILPKFSGFDYVKLKIPCRLCSPRRSPISLCVSRSFFLNCVIIASTTLLWIVQNCYLNSVLSCFILEFFYSKRFDQGKLYRTVNERSRISVLR